MGSPTYDRVLFLDEAIEDMRRLAERSRPVLVEVLRRLKRLDAGTEWPEPLQDFTKTGDLRDCGKIAIRLDGEPEYRVVVRTVVGHLQVCEVVAVDQRADDLAYLLAGLRLGRIQHPVRKSDVQRRIWRLRNLRRQ